MRQILFVLVPIFFLGLLMVGGLGSNKRALSPTDIFPVTINDSGKAKEENSLQIRSLTGSLSCANGGKVAVDILVDTSSSMKKDAGNGRSRMENLKTAVKSFVGLLKSDDVVGLQRFSKDARNLVSPNTIQINSDKIKEQVQGLTPSGDTFTEKGLRLAQSEVEKAKPAFPGYSWYILLISDGSPDDSPLSVARSINQSGIKIITMGFGFGSSELDYTQAIALMKQMAYTTDYFFEPQSNNLSEVVAKIAGLIGCSATPTP